MADYWKSQPRKFCEFCKCWIADNKPSRDFHEKGKKHQQNVQDKINQVMKKGAKDAKNEDSMAAMLKKMDEDAMKAFKKDIQQNPSMASQYGVQNKPKEPDPKPPEKPVETASVAPKEENSTSGTESEPHPNDIWKEEWTPEGYVYYWHTITGESKWEPPEGYTPTWERKSDGENKDEAKPTKETEDVDDSSPSSAETDTNKDDTEESDRGEEQSREEISENKTKNLEETEALPAPVLDISTCDIPLPGDIPLPPPTPSETEVTATETKVEDTSNTAENDTPSLPNPAPVRRREVKNSPYGAWETIPEPVETPAVDLQLPKTSSTFEVKTIPVNEPKIKFRQKKVDTLGAEFVAFKKRKMNAANRKDNIRTTDTEKD